MPNNTEEFIPENLKLWALPDSYSGNHWEGFYVFLGKHRDSDLLSESNFDVGYSKIKELNTELENGDKSIRIIREGHWAVGWVEWIGIHESNIPALKVADSIQDKLNDYPVIDESNWSEREDKEANRIWKENYSTKERINYIRENESQFDFSDYSDLISVVRGKYFSGYASELIG